jgi:hypothetical protein
VTHAASTAVGERLIDALRRRDYDAIGGCFAPDATMRSVVPPGPREDDGADAISRRFRLWTAEMDPYEVLEADTASFEDMLRLRWTVRGIDRSEADPALATFEQTAYAEVDGDAITAMRLACSGRRVND